MSNSVMFKYWSGPILFFVISFLCSSYSSALENQIKNEAIYIISEYGTIDKFDSNWHLLSSNKVPGLFLGLRVHDADISPDGGLLFLAVSADPPLIIINTKDMSIREHSIKFPQHAFASYFPESLIAFTSQYLYMADESYTGLADPFMDIMIDINKGTAMRLPSQISLNKEDVIISSQRDKVASRGLEKINVVDVLSGKLIDSIGIPTEYRGRALTPIDVDWANNKITIRKTKSADGQSASKITIDMVSHESVTQKDEKFNIGNTITKIHLHSDGMQYLIEDDKANLYVVDKSTGKVVYSVEQNITSALKGHNLRLRSYLAPDSTQVIYLKDDKKEHIPQKGEYGAIDRYVYFSRLTAIDLKTNKIMKNIEFPEKIVAVLFSTKN